MNHHCQGYVKYNEEFYLFPTPEILQIHKPKDKPFLQNLNLITYIFNSVSQNASTIHNNLAERIPD